MHQRQPAVFKQVRSSCGQSQKQFHPSGPQLPPSHPVAHAHLLLATHVPCALQLLKQTTGLRLGLGAGLRLALGEGTGDRLGLALTLGAALGLGTGSHSGLRRVVAGYSHWSGKAWGARSQDPSCRRRREECN